MDRRHFIKLGISTVAASGLISSRVSHANSADDYKALVCINFDGGNDGFSMVLPKEENNFRAYQDIRGELALQPGRDTTAADAETTALNGDLTSVAGSTIYYHNKINHNNLIKAGFDGGSINGHEYTPHLAAVLNVGNLIEPISAQNRRRAKRPPQLFAHGDQKTQVFRCASNTKTGWGGRIMQEVARQHNSGSELFSGIKIGGVGAWHANSDALGVALSPSGQQPSRSYFQGASDSLIALRKELSASLNQSLSDDLMIRQLQNLNKNSSEYLAAVGKIYNDDVHAVGLSQTTIDGLTATSLGHKLLQVLRVISARGRFSINRQLFSVSLGGFDTHSGHDDRQPALFSHISKAMAHFRDGLTELGVFDNVVTFTMSEFGRSMTNNGNGTDHGWGNNHFVMGGAVNSALYGRFPDFTANSGDYWAKGRIYPSLSIEQYTESMLSWFGLTDEQKNRVMPRRNNFDLTAVDFFSSSG